MTKDANDKVTDVVTYEEQIELVKLFDEFFKDNLKKLEEVKTIDELNELYKLNHERSTYLAKYYRELAAEFAEDLEKMQAIKTLFSEMVKTVSEFKVKFADKRIELLEKNEETKSLAIDAVFDSKNVTLYQSVQKYVKDASTFADRYGYQRLATTEETYAITKNGVKVFEVDKEQIRTTAAHVTEAIKFYKKQVAEGRYKDEGLAIVLDHSLTDAEIKQVLEATVIENVKVKSIENLIKVGDMEVKTAADINELFAKHGVTSATEASAEVQEEQSLRAKL